MKKYILSDYQIIFRSENMYLPYGEDYRMTVL